MTGNYRYTQPNGFDSSNFIKLIPLKRPSKMIIFGIENNEILDKPSMTATSGLIDAAFITDGITSGRYCVNSVPNILHILAQAEII